MAKEVSPPGSSLSRESCTTVIGKLAPGGQTRKRKASPNQLLIAALGASAGGLEALKKFFEYTPGDSGVAFLVAQHLAPDHSSALPELLARCTQMPVEQALDNIDPAPNHVYIIPPGVTLTIQHGKLRVTAPAEPRGHRMPIDSLFRSLAQDRGENAVCIMLSGTGTDGTLGLREIKESGGLAMAQSPESAKYDGILRSAISTGLVDYVLTAEEMPAKLMEYAAYLHSLDGKPNHIREQIAAHLGKIHGLLRRRAGHDFSQYKESTVVRRVDRSMKALQMESVGQYVQVLDSRPEEADRLSKDLLTGVTQFFRDPESFQALARDAIPKLFEGKKANDEVRACVVGCASGEEAYSVAILLSEHSSTLDNPPRLKIFATDIDERGLEAARKGRYPEGIAQHVSPERLERFFSKHDRTYKVKRELREICIFSTHSFIEDPPFSRLDLVSCRNVMVYLGPDLQRKVMPLFHYALRSGGYLFLGPAESAAEHRELFRELDKKHRIFQKNDTLPRPPVRSPFTDISRPAQPRMQTEAAPPGLSRQLEQIVLQRYRPACVAVQENGEAVYFSGRTGRYLEQPAGSPETNVINMAREDLRTPLRTALHQAVTARKRAVQRGVPVQTNGGTTFVDIAVEPLTEFHSADLYMIVFEDATAGPTAQRGEASAPDAASEEIVRHLESELRAAQEYAQAAFEELETSNEELKSANEEFQCTNEELETSKEELQSFNEELEAVNNELNRKVTEIDKSNSDLQNLFDSTQIATIFLDGDLRIRSFTPAAINMFRLIAGDVGRRITDLAARFHDVDLARDIGEVLQTLSARERQLAGEGGRHYQMRILPYRTIHNVIDGVVITFMDVTELNQAKNYAENIVRTVREPLLVLNADLRVHTANRSFYEMFRVTAEQTEGSLLQEPCSGQWDIPELRTLPQQGTLTDLEVERDFPDIGRKTMLLNARLIQNSNAQLILLALEDITERKRAEDALRASEEERYRTLFESIDEGFCIIEKVEGERLDFRYLAANPAFETQSGAGGVVGKTIRQAFPERPEEWLETYDDVVTNGEPLRFERGLITQGRVLEIYAFRIKDETRRRVGVIFKDITEPRRSQDLLRSANADLKHFAYAASHDLQEPLRMVTCYTQLLAREYKGRLDQEADQFITYATEGAQRMERMLSGLREYWSVSEQEQHRPVLIDCNILLENVRDMLATAIEESGGVVTHDPLPTFLSEETPLFSLLQNLVGNALKYRRPGEPPRAHVSAERSTGNWIFSVRDSGIGIEAEYLERIFAPFKRLNGSEYAGSGIGLAICKKIAERLGGRIWAESEYGCGATFRFTIPA